MILFIIVTLLIAVAIGVAYLIFLLTTSAILFAKVAFSLLAALIVSMSSDSMLVPDNGFLNYIAWAVLAIGAVYLLSSLPRVDIALRFLCTAIMSVLAIELVLLLCGGLIGAVIGEPFVMTALYEILVKLVCVAVSVFGMISQGGRWKSDRLTNPIACILERLLASAMYGIGITFLAASFHENWQIPSLISVILFAVCTLGAYIADIKLANKDLFGITVENSTVVPK